MPMNFSLRLFIESDAFHRQVKGLKIPDLETHLALHFGPDALWGWQAWSGHGYYARSSLLMISETAFVLALSDQTVSCTGHHQLRTIRTSADALDLDFVPPVFGEAPITVPVRDWADAGLVAFMSGLQQARRAALDSQNYRPAP